MSTPDPDTEHVQRSTWLNRKQDGRELDTYNHIILYYWIHPPLAQNYALHDLEIHMITCIFAPGSLGQEVFKNPALGQLAFSALKTCCFSCTGIINRPQDLQVSQDSMPDSLRSPLKVPKRIQSEHDKARWTFETRHFVGCYAMLLSNQSVMLTSLKKGAQHAVRIQDLTM